MSALRVLAVAGTSWCVRPPSLPLAPTMTLDVRRYIRKVPSGVPGVMTLLCLKTRVMVPDVGDPLRQPAKGMTCRSSPLLCPIPFTESSYLIQWRRVYLSIQSRASCPQSCPSPASRIARRLDSFGISARALLARIHVVHRRPPSQNAPSARLWRLAVVSRPSSHLRTYLFKPPPPRKYPWKAVLVVELRVRIQSRGRHHCNIAAAPVKTQPQPLEIAGRSETGQIQCTRKRTIITSLNP